MLWLCFGRFDFKSDRIDPKAIARYFRAPNVISDYDYHRVWPMVVGFKSILNFSAAWAKLMCCVPLCVRYRWQWIYNSLQTQWSSSIISKICRFHCMNVMNACCRAAYTQRSHTIADDIDGIECVLFVFLIQAKSVKSLVTNLCIDSMLCLHNRIGWKRICVAVVDVAAVAGSVCQQVTEKIALAHIELTKTAVQFFWNRLNVSVLRFLC